MGKKLSAKVKRQRSNRRRGSVSWEPGGELHTEYINGCQCKICKERARTGVAQWPPAPKKVTYLVPSPKDKEAGE